MRPEAVDLTLCEQIERTDFDSTNVYEKDDVVAFRYVGYEEPTRQNEIDINWKGKMRGPKFISQTAEILFYSSGDNCRYSGVN